MRTSGWLGRPGGIRPLVPLILLLWGLPASETWNKCRLQLARLAWETRRPLCGPSLRPRCVWGRKAPVSVTCVASASRPICTGSQAVNRQCLGRLGARLQGLPGADELQPRIKGLDPPSCGGQAPTASRPRDAAGQN